MLDLLKARNFRTVISIDDENALPPVNSNESFARELVKTKARRRKTLVNKEPFFAEVCKLAEPREDVDNETLQADVRAWLDRAGDEVTGDRLKQASDILLEGITGPTHEKLRRELHQADIQLRAFSFGEWQKSGNEVLATATSSSRVLLLVDEVNDKEPEVDLNGKMVLRDILSIGEEKLPFVDAILVTSSCEPADELEKSHALYEQISELLKNNGLKQSFKKVFVLSKTRLSDDSFLDSFRLHINRIEASRLSTELADATKKVLELAVQDSLDWLKKIPLMEFHHSVFVTAETEGAAESDTLVRLASIRQRVALERLLREDKRVQSCIEEMRKFTPDGFGGSVPRASKSALKELREQEFERSGSHVNLLRVPLACGDVFKFKTVDSKDTSHEFTAMLLVNPCDLVLRQNGSRKLSTGLLVQVKKVNNAQAEELVEREKIHPPLLYCLATGSQPDDTAYLFYNNKVESGPLQLLDLCWTNEDGIAKFDPKGLTESFASFASPQKARLENLSLRAEQERFAHLELWGTDLRVVLKKVDSQKFGTVETTSSVEYQVTREWRLAPEFAAAALSALSQAISRPAFGHDYLKP